MYFSWVSTIEQCETRGGALPPTFRQDNAFERVRVSLAPTLPVFVYVGARPGRRRLLTLPPLAGGLPPPVAACRWQTLSEIGKQL